jgi:hypothetical protein
MLEAASIFPPSGFSSRENPGTSTHNPNFATPVVGSACGGVSQLKISTSPDFYRTLPLCRFFTDLFLHQQVAIYFVRLRFSFFFKAMLQILCEYPTSP